MPISWRGTLQQYAGRLHRLFQNKKEVQIYDYVDIHIRALEKMYQKRLAGYAAIGYRARGESLTAEPADIIFDNTNFLPVYHNDLMNAAREVVIVSPFVTRRRALQMLPNLEAALAKRVSVVVVTRPTNAYKKRTGQLWKKPSPRFNQLACACCSEPTSIKNLPSSTRKSSGTAASIFSVTAVPKKASCGWKAQISPRNC